LVFTPKGIIRRASAGELAPFLFRYKNPEARIQRIVRGGNIEHRTSKCGEIEEAGGVKAETLKC
jgi:hypothetical protein